MQFFQFTRDPKLDWPSTLGLSRAALTGAFFGPTPNAEVPEPLKGIPHAQRAFAKDEYLASALTFQGVRRGGFWVPDPWSGEEREASSVITARARGSLPLDILPLFYRFLNAAGMAYWVCCYSLYGRVTQIYVPHLDCVIYHVGLERAVSLIESLTPALEDPINESQSFDSMVSGSGLRIGILDLQLNFGHQLIHHLSGIQRLIDESLENQIDEIWLFGTEFFGDTESLFPEFAGRIRRFSDKWKLNDSLPSNSLRIFKIGSTFLTKDLAARILARIPWSRQVGKASRYLIVTVRADGRRCVNLADVVAKVYGDLLQNHPDLRVILDGWVFPEATILSDEHLRRVRREMDEAQAICDALPSGAVAKRVIGRSILESIGSLPKCAVYLSHVGTLQHKLAFLAQLPGVVHGPRAQLTKREGGMFLSGAGLPSQFLDIDAVEDIPVHTERGSDFFDYKIVDISALVRLLDNLLSTMVA